MLLRYFSFVLLLSLLATGCSSDDPSELPEEEEIIEFDTPDWTETTHGKNTDPAYDVVFSQGKVNTLEIEMTAATWSKIQADMKSIYGAAFGQPSIGVGGKSNEEPVYVGVSMKFNGIEWYQVGFRLKGNSTLGNTWRNGIYKLPFRLNMDYFEDKYPQIKNQRFYGFKELSMSPGTNDNSLIREKAASDIFNMAGIASSQTAFYKVYINFGNGLKYCGIYTMVEVVDDTMVQNRFGEDSGNIYKPETTFEQYNKTAFEKKNNEDEDDFSDAQAFIVALHNTNRTTSPATWRAGLEQVFNTDHFLRWLAANTVMLNWDTYGKMPHNFYLYNDPGKGLTWIPWDNNEAMFVRGNVNDFRISLNTVNTKWPLIRYLLDDPVYQAKYREYVVSFTGEIFTPEKMNTLFTTHHELIAPYVVGPEEQEVEKYTHLGNPIFFNESVEQLNDHVIMRNEAVEEFLE